MVCRGGCEAAAVDCCRRLAPCARPSCRDDQRAEAAAAAAAAAAVAAAAAAWGNERVCNKILAVRVLTVARFDDGDNAAFLLRILMLPMIMLVAVMAVGNYCGNN